MFKKLSSNAKIGLIMEVIAGISMGVLVLLDKPMGFVNEKKAGGSILPSWCIHAVANLFSGICSAFMLFQ